jgi:hypothetical protein
MTRFFDNITDWARRFARAADLRTPAFGLRRAIAAFTLALALSTTPAAETTNSVSVTNTNSSSDSAATTDAAPISITSTNIQNISTNSPNTASLSTNLPASSPSTNAPAQSAAADAEAKDVIGFNEFKIITERNIFNPNRRAPGRSGRTEDRPKPTRVDYLNLVGAMSYEKGRFAFFDGSSSEYRKSVKPGESIAGYKVASVANDKVTLQKDDKKIELPVGGQLKREDEGEWRVNANAESFASSTNSSDSTSSSSVSQSSSSSSGPKSDSSSDESNPVLKRLLEARKQGK